MSRMACTAAANPPSFLSASLDFSLANFNAGIRLSVLFSQNSKLRSRISGWISLQALKFGIKVPIGTAVGIGVDENLGSPGKESSSSFAERTEVDAMLATTKPGLEAPKLHDEAVTNAAKSTKEIIVNAVDSVMRLFIKSVQKILTCEKHERNNC